jgi:hypothetical protein
MKKHHNTEQMNWLHVFCQKSFSRQTFDQQIKYQKNVWLDPAIWAQCYQTFYSRNMNFHNKLECLFIASFSALSNICGWSTYFPGLTHKTLD